MACAVLLVAGGLQSFRDERTTGADRIYTRPPDAPRRPPDVPARPPARPAPPARLRAPDETPVGALPL